MSEMTLGVLFSVAIKNKKGPALNHQSGDLILVMPPILVIQSVGKPYIKKF
jgi:hypothetical protein